MTASVESRLELVEARRAELSERRAVQELLIGKDILELLSTAMYVEPLTVFREYVQNAADAIDEARDSGLLTQGQPGRIEIMLDGVARTAVIRDNGIGIGAADVERVLTAFGASRKRAKIARGFRGVGRLAALGYAQALVFRTKAAGERDISEVRWDCRRLKAILLDPAYAGDLGSVVSEVVTIRTLRAPDPAEHFFEVRLDKVLRIKNDVLLNAEEVRRYLAQVAPAPFMDSFAFKQAILTHIGPYVSEDRFQITINEGSAHLTRPEFGEFEIRKGRQDVATGVRLVEIKGGDGNVRAVGWLLEHGFEGAIQGSSDIRGLRARVGNIQIGGDDIFAAIFPETRFNSWTVGELHIVDRSIIPNGRRDNFEQNSAYYQLLSELIPIGRELARRCRTSSARRNRIKMFELRYTRAEELVLTISQGTLGRNAESAARREVGALLAELERLIGGELVTDDDRRPLKRRIDRLRAKVPASGSVARRIDPLSTLPQRKRAVYKEVIDLIYECATNRIAAQALVNRITARLSTG